jgi:nucleoside-triphosphatase
MEDLHKNLLVTGVPGIGKSTLIRKVIDELGASKAAGFYTEEIRVDGVRKGFDLISLDGRKRKLAHIDLRSRFMVGKYRVNVYGFDRYLDGLDLAASKAPFVIIDEIGRMECLSRKFRHLIFELLDQDRIVIASIAQQGGGAIEAIKQRDDITLFEMNKRNREDLVTKVLRRVHLIRFS